MQPVDPGYSNPYGLTQQQVLVNHSTTPNSPLLGSPGPQVQQGDTADLHAAFQRAVAAHVLDSMFNGARQQPAGLGPQLAVEGPRWRDAGRSGPAGFGWALPDLHVEGPVPGMSPQLQMAQQIATPALYRR